MTVFITGSDGMLGEKLVGIFLRKGWKVIAAEEENSPYVGWANYSALPQGLENKALIKNVFFGTKIDALVHLKFSIGNDIRNNTERDFFKPARIIDNWLYTMAAEAEIEKIVLLSSVEAEGFKKRTILTRWNSYGKIKAHAESALRESSKRTIMKNIIIRPTESYMRQFCHPLAVKLYEELLSETTMPERIFTFL